MEKKSEILKQMALISDNIDKMPYTSKKVKITLYLNDSDFIDMFNLFTNKKITEDDYKFSISIDNIDFEIFKIF